MNARVPNLSRRQFIVGTSAITTGLAIGLEFPNVSWTGAITARCALIYNSSKANRSVAVLDFGSDKTSITTFTVEFPAATNTAALIRLS